MSKKLSIQNFSQNILTKAFFCHIMNINLTKGAVKMLKFSIVKVNNNNDNNNALILMGSFIVAL